MATSVKVGGIRITWKFDLNIRTQVRRVSLVRAVLLDSSTYSLASLRVGGANCRSLPSTRIDVATVSVLVLLVAI